MEKILIKNIDAIYTFDDNDKIVYDGDILIEGPSIVAIGKDLSDEGATIIDGKGKVCLPGFVNTHHHFYQALFRGIKEVQEMPLFPWLKGLYSFWQHLDEETVYYSGLVAMGELLRTGCTLTADHHYVFPEGASEKLIDRQIDAARDIGMRLLATRGSMSRGERDGGLPPQSVVQSEDVILADSERLITTYHDKKPFAMTQIALAPCSPFSVTKELMTSSQELARKHGVMLHTHLAETMDEEAFCMDMYGMRPVELMEETGWIGRDVWFAHGIYFNDEELQRLQGSGIAHCPSSNMKLGSGICRTTELFEKGVPLSIAVDGSASNDGSNLWEEVRRAYLLNHLKYGDRGLEAYKILRIATRGGAEVLGRNDTGYLAEGMAADLNLFDLSDIAYAGSHDPLVSLVCLGNSSFTDKTIVNGKVVADRGKLLTIDEEAVFAKANEIARNHVQKERDLKKI